MLIVNAPSPGFDDPIALLRACHEKVRRFAGLSLRLDEHVKVSGADDIARKAASDILRYFNLAAPLHHDDEEQDLFPALRELGDVTLTNTLDELEAEHEDLARLWLAVRGWLDDIVAGNPCPGPIELADFATRYTAHADREERDVYGATDRLPAPIVKALGLRMSQRRSDAIHT